MAQQKFPKAYEAYQQAVYRDGRNPTFWCSIGVLYYQINQYRDALDAYSRAIRLNPYISEVWYDLGTLVSHTPITPDFAQLTSFSMSHATIRQLMRLMRISALLSWIPTTHISRLGYNCCVAGVVPDQMLKMPQSHRMFILRPIKLESVFLLVFSGECRAHPNRRLSSLLLIPQESMTGLEASLKYSHRSKGPCNPPMINVIVCAHHHPVSPLPGRSLQEIIRNHPGIHHSAKATHLPQG